jgi:hypothetical protein
MLQAGRSPVQVPDKVHIFNLPNPSNHTVALGSTQPLTEMSTSWCVGLTTSLPSVNRMSENVGASTSRNPKGLHGLSRDNFTSYMSWGMYEYSLQCGKCCRKFHRKYPDCTVPCKEIIYNTITKLCFLRLLLDKKKSILSEGQPDDISAWLGSKFKKVIMSFTLQCGLAKGKTLIRIKPLKLWPHKTTLIHSLLSPDCEAKIWYCR